MPTVIIVISNLLIDNKQLPTTFVVSPQFALCLKVSANRVFFGMCSWTHHEEGETELWDGQTRKKSDVSATGIQDWHRVLQTLIVHETE